MVPGDCRRKETLERAGVAAARGVLVLTNDDQLNVSTALMARSLNRDVRIVVRMFNQNLLSRLGKAVQNVFALSTSNLTAPLLALTALTGHALGTFRLQCEQHNRRQVAGVTVTPTSPLRGRTLAEVESNARNLRDRQAHFESQLLSVPSHSWPEAAAKARYVLNLYAAGLSPEDSHHRDLVAAILEDFSRLAAWD